MKYWRIIKILGFLVGAFVLFYYLQHLGAMKVLRLVVQIKWWAILVILNSFIWVLFYTAAWRTYFSNLTRKIPFLHLLRVKLCGEAVNLMTPVSFMAGDPVRVLLLEKQLGPSTRLASVIVDRILNALATTSFVITGMMVVFSKAVLISSELRWIIIFVYFCVISGLTFLVAELVRGKGFRRFHRILLKFRFAHYFPKLDQHLVHLNDELSGFSGGQLRPFLQAFFFHLMGRVMGVFELGIIFTYLTGSPYLLFSLMLVSMTSMTHFIFSFIPGGIGIVESLYASFFAYFGFDPALGVSMQLIRRLRAIFWIGVGVILLNLSGFKREHTKGTKV